MNQETSSMYSLFAESTSSDNLPTPSNTGHKNNNNSNINKHGKYKPNKRNVRLSDGLRPPARISSSGTPTISPALSSADYHSSSGPSVFITAESPEDIDDAPSPQQVEEREFDEISSNNNYPADFIGSEEGDSAYADEQFD